LDEDEGVSELLEEASWELLDTGHATMPHVGVRISGSGSVSTKESILGVSALEEETALELLLKASLDIVMTSVVLIGAAIAPARKTLVVVIGETTIESRLDELRLKMLLELLASSCVGVEELDTVAVELLVFMAWSLLVATGSSIQPVSARLEMSPSAQALLTLEVVSRLYEALRDSGAILIFIIRIYTLM